MKSIIFIITFNVLSVSIAFSQAGWIQQETGLNCDFNSVFFINESIGWTVGGRNIDTGVILKTMDSGSNWFVQVHGTYGMLYSVFFVDQNTGYTAGSRFYSGRIYKTTDGGTSWIDITPLSFDARTFKSIYFPSSLVGYAVGDSSVFQKGLILKTTNAGLNWTKLSRFNIGEYNPINSCFFISVDTGWVAGGYGIVYKTFNGGLNWINQGYFGQPSNSVFFVDSQTGWVVADGLDSIIFKTTNGGNNWETQTCDSVSDLSSVYFVSPLVGWAVGGLYEETIIKTSDGGLNWYHQTSGMGTHLGSLYFTAPDIGYAVGSFGIILKTTTGGEPIGIKSISSEIPKSFSLSQNYPNPFNPSTKIRFDIPATPLSSIGEGPGVRLTIYDILGRKVTALVNEQLKPGTYEVEWDAGDYSSGVYFYTLQTESFSETKKMVLIK